MRLSQTFPQLSADTRRNLVACFFTGLLFWSSMASQLPVLPLYVDSLGGTEVQVGSVMGAFAIGLLLCRAYLGRLADRRGRRIVMQIGLAVAAVMPLCYAISNSIPLLMVFRAVHGISIAAFATGYSALTSDLAPPEQRGEIIGYMSLVNPLGLGIGPALGGWIQATWGYQNLFIVAACLAMMGYIVTREIQEDGYAYTLQGAAVRDLGVADHRVDLPFWPTLFSPRIKVPALILFLIGLVFGNLSAFLPLLIKAQKIPFNVGLFYMAAAIAGFIVRLPLAKISDRYGRGLFISLGLCFYATSMLTIFASHTAPHFLIAGIFEGIGAGIAIPAIVTLLADRTVSAERGFVFGLAWAGFDLGIALAGPVMGNIIPRVGLANSFLITAGLSMLAIAIFSTQANHSLTESLRFATGKSQDKFAV
jgi:MFS family permease